MTSIEHRHSNYDRLDREATGLIMFDLLEGGFGEVALQGDYGEGKRTVLQKCRELLHSAREVGLPTFFTRPIHRADGADATKLYYDRYRRVPDGTDPELARLIQHEHRTNLAGHPDSEVVNALSPISGDYVISKNRWSAFYQTNLELCLRTAEIQTIVLCGSAVGSGVSATAYSARDRDINVVVVKDAVFSYDSAALEWWMNDVFPSMARVREVSDVIAMLG